MYTIVLLYVKICLADCSGWELRLRLQDLDVRHDVRLCGARRRTVSDVNFARFHHTVGSAPGTLGLGLPQILFSA
jgi:hypothetical protein